jgi:hypothetical protein
LTRILYCLERWERGKEWGKNYGIWEGKKKREE